VAALAPGGTARTVRGKLAATQPVQQAQASWHPHMYSKALSCKGLEPWLLERRCTGAEGKPAAEHGAATERRAAQTLLVSFTSLLSYVRAEFGPVEASNTR